MSPEAGLLPFAGGAGWLRGVNIGGILRAICRHMPRLPAPVMPGGADSALEGVDSTLEGRTEAVVRPLNRFVAISPEARLLPFVCAGWWRERCVTWLAALETRFDTRACIGNSRREVRSIASLLGQDNVFAIRSIKLAITWRGRIIH
eukprot:1194044-Prorocentrum_minimum.AAC.1